MHCRGPNVFQAAHSAIAASVLFAFACSTTMAAESPRAELEFFRGEWTIKGHEATYSESCEWLAGRGFIACNAEDRSEPEPSYSMSIFGYSEADGQYTYTGFSGAGTQRSLRGHVHSSVWRFYGQSDRAPNWRRWQVTITPTPEGFHFFEEVSERSGPWRRSAELTYVRKRTGPS